MKLGRFVAWRLAPKRLTLLEETMPLISMVSSESYGAAFGSNTLKLGMPSIQKLVFSQGKITVRYNQATFTTFVSLQFRGLEKSVLTQPTETFGILTAINRQSTFTLTHTWISKVEHSLAQLSI